MFKFFFTGALKKHILPANTANRATTQQFLEIEDIQDDLIILKNGACSLVLRVTAINFGLLSEEEQDAIIYAYAALLNSLTFPIQILIMSQKKDISSYLKLLISQEAKLKNQLLLKLMVRYRSFVEEIVKKNEVLDKKFYIAIPFSPLEMGLSSGISQSFGPKNKLPAPKQQIIEKAKVSLLPKKDHLVSQIGRLGISAKQLSSQELIKLFYGIYNPESVGQTMPRPKDYTQPIVETMVRQSPDLSPGATNQSVTQSVGQSINQPNQSHK